MPAIPVVNISSSEFKANPFPFYARLRSEAPVYRTILPDKQSTWLITRCQPADDHLRRDSQLPTGDQERSGRCQQQHELRRTLA